MTVRDPLLDDAAHPLQIGVALRPDMVADLAFQILIMVHERPDITRMLRVLPQDVDACRSQAAQRIVRSSVRVESGQQRAHMRVVHREEDGVLAGEIMVERRLAEAHLIRQHLHRRLVIPHPVEQRCAMPQYLVALLVMRFGRLPFLCCFSRHCRLCSLFCVPTSRSEEHTSELQSLMRISYAVFCLKKNKLTLNTSTI